jgi:hypothetical protein
MLRPVAVVASLVALVTCGSDEGTAADAARTRADQARDVAREAGLSPAVQAILADAAGAVDETYTVVYRIGGAGVGRSVVVQDPPHRRIELEVATGDLTVTRLFIANDDGTFACTRATDRWQCQRNADAPAGLGPLALGDVQEATQDLLDAKEDYTFTVERQQIAGVEARCLVTALKPGRQPDQRGERAVLCISPEGVPLRVEASTGALTATSYRRSAAAEAFRLPAPPRNPAPTTSTTTGAQ